MKIVSYKFFMAFLAVLMMASLGNAQFYSSALNTDAGNPRGLNDGSDSETTGWTILLDASLNANTWSAADSIPFSFEFFGTPVTHFKVSGNGLLTFDTTATGTPLNANTNLPSAGLPDQTIAVMWDEFTDSPPTGTNDRVYTKLYGTAPARQLWIKWFSFEYGNPSVSFSYFSCVLEETSNSVFVVDMYSSTSPLLTTTVGLQENGTTAVQFGDSLIAQAGNAASNSDNDYWEFFIPVNDDVGPNYLTPLAFSATANDIRIGVENFGLNAASNFDISYSVDDGSSGTMTYAGTLNPGEADTVTMTTPWTPAAAGTYQIKAYTTYASDGNLLNDTLTLSVDVFDKVPLDLTEDFSSYSGTPSNIGWLGADNADFGMFIPGSSSDGAWTRDDFGNDASISGDAARFNLFSTTSDDKDWLITPPIDMTTGDPGAVLEFDVAVTPYTGTDTTSINPGDTLFVVVSTDGQNWLRSNILAAYTADDFIPPTGMRESLDLTAYAGETNLFIGFLAMDPPNPGDMNVYIDNVFVGTVAAIDMAVTGVTGFPLLAAPSSTVNFDVYVSNLGQNTVTTDTLDIWLNGAVTSTYEVTALAAGESDTISASVTTSASGNDQLVAALRYLPGDADPLNDTLATELLLPPSAFMEMWDTDVFDPARWPSVVGTPEIIDTNGVASGTFPYKVPSLPYFLSLNGSGAELTSGVFDLTGLSDYSVSFYESEHDLEVGEDVIGEYYTSAMTWDTLFYFPGTNNGFGVYEPFEKVIILLPSDAYHSQFQIRFRTIGALSTTDEWFFDDIRVGPVQDDIAALRITKPYLTMTPLSQPGLLASIPLEGRFRNLGLDNTGDLNVAITDESGTVVHSETLPGVTINAFSDSMFAFSPANAIGADSGRYDISIYPSAFPDADATNDTVTISHLLGDQMGYDNGVLSTSGTFSSSAHSWFASRFTLTLPDTLRSARILISDATSDTDSFSVELWSVSNDTPSTRMAIIYTGNYVDVGTRPALVDFEIPGGYALPAGDFAIVFDMIEQTLTGGSFPCGIDFTALGAQNVPRTFWGKLETTDWLVFEEVGAGTWTPIMRAVFGSSTPFIATLPFHEGFNDTANTTIPNLWTQIDADGGDEVPGADWRIVPNGIFFPPLEGAGEIGNDYQAANASGLIDEWLITPQLLDYQSGMELSFWLTHIDDIWDDSVMVMVSTASSDPADFTMIDYINCPVYWTKYSYDLESYGVNPGDNFYIAFRYYLTSGGSSGTHSNVFSMDEVKIDFPPEAQSKLLISEFVATPTNGEFIEIYNPTQDTVDLSNYYISDATFAGDGTYYYQVVEGGGGGGGFADFNARFPDGATILPDEYQTIALAGDSLFFVEYGVMPTYELYEDSTASANDAPDMREAVPGSINGQGGLTNSDEVIILYYWDGMSDLVQDVDYVLYNSGSPTPNNEAVDKTGVRIDGPDAGSDSSLYLPDTDINDQVSAINHSDGASTHRIDYTEGTQVQTGGNGVTGGDETSENLNETFTNNSKPTPNAPWEPLTGIADKGSILPNAYALHQNYPNPFNPTTTIRYDLKEVSDVTITIYNMLGQTVRTLVNQRQDAGYKTVIWDGMNDSGKRVASGIYIYQIQAGDFIKARKMILMK